MSKLAENCPICGAKMEKGMYTVGLIFNGVIRKNDSLMEWKPSLIELHSCKLHMLKLIDVQTVR